MTSLSPEEQRVVGNDHDLLIAIDTKLGVLIDQYNKHADFATKELSNLNSTKLDKEVFDNYRENKKTVELDTETRLRRVERWGAMAVGIIGFIQFAVSVFK